MPVDPQVQPCSPPWRRRAPRTSRSCRCPRPGTWPTPSARCRATSCRWPRWATAPCPGPPGPCPSASTPDGSPRGAIVHFHGGGWVTGNIEVVDAPCRALADATGCVVVSAQYRLAPESAYPAAAEDCYAVTAWSPSTWTSWAPSPPGWSPRATAPAATWPPSSR